MCQVTTTTTTTGQSTAILPKSLTSKITSCKPTNHTKTLTEGAITAVRFLSRVRISKEVWLDAKPTAVQHESAQSPAAGGKVREESIIHSKTGTKFNTPFKLSGPQMSGSMRSLNNGLGLQPGGLMGQRQMVEFHQCRGEWAIGYKMMEPCTLGCPLSQI